MAMLATAAQADDLTPSSYSYVVADNGFYNTTPTDQSYALDANLTVSVYGSSASSSSTPGVPALEVSGNSSDSGHDFANGGYATGSEAYINFDYAYQVENASGPVPVDVSYSLEAQMVNMVPFDSNTEAISTIQVIQQPYPDANTYYDTYYSDYADAGVTAQTVDGTFLTSATPDAANLVELSVKEETTGGPSATSSAEADADPHIYIDPAYLAANPGATLEISPGVGNIGPTAISAAPEPSTWLLMFAGIGGIGLMLRRKKPESGTLAGAAAI